MYRIIIKLHICNDFSNSESILNLRNYVHCVTYTIYDYYCIEIK